MKSISLLLSAVMVAVMVTGCGLIKKTGTTVTDEKSDVKTTVVGATASGSYGESQTAPLLGSWAISAIDGKNVVINGDNHPQITIKANPDAKTAVQVIVFNGCNYINGVWNVIGSKLEANGEFLTSLMMCHDAPYEGAITQAVNKVRSYTVVNENTITLNAADGSALMTLRKRNLAFLNGAWKVTAIQNSEVPTDVAVKIVIDIDEAKIHGNAGCNVLNGAIVVKLDKQNGIEFKDLVTTRMTCPAMNTERAFLLALEQVDNCEEGQSADQAIMKSSDGQTLLTLVRISPDQIGD